MPITREYNLNVEYEFAPNWLLQVSYVGSSGINQFDEYRIQNVPALASPSNPIPCGPNCTPQTANTIKNIPLRVPIVGFATGGLQTTSEDGLDNYNSLQVTLKKDFSHGLLMQAAYTWSKNLTNLSGNGANSNQYAANTNNTDDINDQYAPSPYERPQRFSVYYTYNLPFTNHPGALGEIVNDWIVSGTTIVQDGNPMTLYDSGGGTIYGTNTSTAELCPGMTAKNMLAHVSHEQQARTGLFNAAAFCNEPTIGNGTDFGNSPIGGVLGPGQFNWDASLQKNFKITERHTFELRGEFYNLANHPQFAIPTGQGFRVNLARLPNGQIAPTDQSPLVRTSVNPRLIQFGLRYRF
jgi:hypothetical protein